MLYQLWHEDSVSSTTAKSFSFLLDYITLNKT